MKMKDVSDSILSANQTCFDQKIKEYSLEKN